MENPFEIIIEKLKAIEKRLDSIDVKISPITAKENESTIMVVSELSKYLRLTVPTIYSKVCRGEKPYMKVSNTLYFDLQEINAWLRKGRVRTNEEIDELADEFLSKSNFKTGNRTTNAVAFRRAASE